LSRADRHWLSEATDLFPLDLPREQDFPMPDVARRGSEREDHTLLAPMLGIVDGKLASEWMPVTGQWSLSSDTSLTLRTVLARPNDARVTVMTLLTDEAFFRWLPDDEDEIARHFGREGHSVRAWIDTVHNAERQFDRHDPYAASTAMSRPSPANWVREQLVLRPDDPIARTWSDAVGLVFRAEAWGAAGGRGENSWEISGERISVDRTWLLTFLERTGHNVVGALKVQRYHKGMSTGRAGGTGAFTHRSYVFMLDRSGRVGAPLRASRLARAAVGALDSNERREFRSRLQAIAAKLAD
jgi:hypothetical protein